ncbi:acetyl esterase/lipase [Agrobacterium vitis]|nr:acetyl esterase/lipase [Agrobacterium vitis]MBE1440345.1 acetyl esterase/lipase [Agrobacterium vitis]
MTSFHPELQRVARWLPRGLGTPLRMRLMRMLPIPAVKMPPGLIITEQRLSEGVGVRIISHVGRTQESPVILWIHGGGFIMGSAKQDDGYCIRLAQDTGATIVSVDYRLAPENPFPVPLYDCFSAFEFIHREASALGWDKRRVVIAGQSAGAGLATALTMLIRDRGLPSPQLQVLSYPMLDDRTPRAKIDGRFHRLWDQASNENGWRSYLGKTYGTEQVSELAAPARSKDLSGLPPAWIGVGTLDLFHDEVLDYAVRLEKAGVPTTLKIVQGAYHGFDVISSRTEIGRQFFESQVSAIREAINNQRQPHNP